MAFCLWYLVLCTPANALRKLDPATMRELVMLNDKVVLLMHEAGCVKAEAFSPTLDEIAEAVPQLGYGRVDVSKPGFEKWRIEPGDPPALRAFFRNAPPHLRILEYVGPPTRDAVEAWCRAVTAWDGSGTAPEGFTVGESILRDTGKDEL